MPYGIRQPVYQALVDDIEAQIESGQLKAGDKIPSLSQLVEQYQASTHTVRSGILVLRAKGLVYGRVGVGVYVASGDE